MYNVRYSEQSHEQNFESKECQFSLFCCKELVKVRKIKLSEALPQLQSKERNTDKTDARHRCHNYNKIEEQRAIIYIA